MKKTFIAISATLLFAGTSAFAADLTPAQVGQIFATVRLADVQNVINWKVGDFHNLKISMAFGDGTGHEEATSEDTAQNAVWLTTTMNIMGQAQETKSLISRTDGKLLKLIVNGQEQDPNAQGKIDIVQQSETTVTVGAGTFDCMYVKANVTQQGQQPQQLEAWINPVQVNLDGMLKMVMQSQIGPITITLEEFGPRH